MVTENKSNTSELNPRQREFCRLVVSGLPAAKAYRDAGFSPIGANAGASRLLSRVSVKAYISELEAIGQRSGKTTRAFVIDKLFSLADNADTDAVQLNATIALGKTEKMFVEVSESSVTHDMPALQAYSEAQLAIMLQQASESPALNDVEVIE